MKVLFFLRGLILTVWFFFHTMLCAITMLLGTQFIADRRFADFVIGTLWARPVLWQANIQVEMRGFANWPSEQGCLVLFNHTSWMDIIVLSACLPRTPRFGAKIELFYIPFFGRAMRRAGMLPIERQRRNKVLQVYKDAEARAKGECFALAPEGTRQEGLQLGRFKQGPFLFSIGAQIPVVPVVIAGAQEVMPRSTWLINPATWKSRVIGQILPAVSSQGMDESKIADMQESVRAMMVPAYERMNQELGLLSESHMHAKLGLV